MRLSYNHADMPRISLGDYADMDFARIEGVVGHEYFHNWTGDRVTCRDWFQLTLKEGLTVFRDQVGSWLMPLHVTQHDTAACSLTTVIACVCYSEQCIWVCQYNPCVFARALHSWLPK